MVNNALDEHFQRPSDAKHIPIVGASKHEVLWGKATRDYTVYNFLMDHKNDMQRLVDRYNRKAAAERFLASLADFTHWARHDTNHEIVVVGHTHIPMVKHLVRVKPQA